MLEKKDRSGEQLGLRFSYTTTDKLRVIAARTSKTLTDLITGLFIARIDEYEMLEGEITQADILQVRTNPRRVAKMPEPVNKLISHHVFASLHRNANAWDVYGWESKQTDYRMPKVGRPRKSDQYAVPHLLRDVRHIVVSDGRDHIKFDLTEQTCNLIEMKYNGGGVAFIVQEVRKIDVDMYENEIAELLSKRIRVILERV